MSKHVPNRMCVVCRKKYEKQSLKRFVLTDEGIFHDPTGKQDGRGAYVCMNPSCQQKITTTNTLGKALGANLSDADLQNLRQVAS